MREPGLSEPLRLAQSHAPVVQPELTLRRPEGSPSPWWAGRTAL